MLETHEGEDMIVVLFRREEARGFGPLYGDSGCRRWSRKKILGSHLSAFWRETWKAG